ncbi:hypothetical protein lerEdw1_002990, partial [Lerista edwardsae]
LPTVSLLHPLGMLAAVKINAKGREVIYLAKGDSVKLGCPYELEPEDHGTNGLDIEWTQINSDPTNLDNVILSYQDHRVIHPGHLYVQQQAGSVGEEGRHFARPGYQQHLAAGGSLRPYPGPISAAGDCCSELQQRVNFAAVDPSQYDASINLQDVQVSDSATYECKVKKTTVATRKVTITVLERPAAPQCSIEGRVAMGREITLRCSSQAGSSPLMYQWAKVASQPFGNWPPPTTTKGPNPGDLVIRNLSREHAGVYQCSVANRVGSARCVLEVSFSGGYNRVALIVGAVLGSLLLLLLLLGLVVGVVCCCKRRGGKGGSNQNQIRVDTAPPRRRGGSRNSSLRSVLDYLPHNISFSQRRKYEPTKAEEGIEMIAPSRDADRGSSAYPGPKGNDSSKGSSSSVVTTKARIHSVPPAPSSTHAKAGGSGSAAPPPPLRANLDHSGSASDRDPAQGKRNRPTQYGGVPVMTTAISRDDLVV